jgi:predicted Zn-dependent peptidase
MTLCAGHARIRARMPNMTSNGVEKTTLPNGLVILTDSMPHVHSVSVGIWLRFGSRREPEAINGISHFIEHMVFKGTHTRSAEDIAREIDSLGGMLDAFTSKEMVCFNTRILDEHLPLAFDIVSDMVLGPRFDAEDIVKEQGVILEEIRMTQDNPEDLVHELFTQNFWHPHALGRPILGTPETVSEFDRATIESWWKTCYAPNRMVITAAGNLTHAQMVELAAAKFSTLERNEEPFTDPRPESTPHITQRSKNELEQVHLCLGVPALPLTDRRRFAVSVLNNILGGGMSSRLFQNIRERRGLAYSIFSDLSPYRDVGVLSVYAGTSLETTGKVVELVLQEFRRMRNEPIEPGELRRAKDHLKGAMLLSLEGSGARMSNLARYHMYFDRHFTPAELITMLEAVTADEVQQVARDFFRPEKIAASIVGNLNGFKLTREQLAF